MNQKQTFYTKLKNFFSEYEREVRMAAVLTFIGLIYCFLMWGNQVEKTKKFDNQSYQYKIDSLTNRCDSLQKLSDSLYDENFPCQIELSRFQLAFEIFSRRNPNGAEEYGTIISEETE